MLKELLENRQTEIEINVGGRVRIELVDDVDMEEKEIYLSSGDIIEVKNDKIYIDFEMKKEQLSKNDIKIVYAGEFAKEVRRLLGI